MSHTHESQSKLIGRVKRIKGQLEAVERMLEKDEDCYKVLQAIASSRGAISGLMNEVLEGHIRHHIGEESDRKKAKLASEEVISVLKSFLK